MDNQITTLRVVKISITFYPCTFIPEIYTYGLRKPRNLVDSYLQMDLININFFLMKRKTSQQYNGAFRNTVGDSKTSCLKETEKQWYK